MKRRVQSSPGSFRDQWPVALAMKAITKIAWPIAMLIKQVLKIDESAPGLR